jgi:hypothetical protein
MDPEMEWMRRLRISCHISKRYLPEKLFDKLKTFLPD